MNATPSAADDPTRRACDSCRLRKIKCDKDWPCANCRIANRTCTSTGAGQRPKEARQRVLISSQYEKKIDQIDSRLGSIEILLRNLTMQSNSGSVSGSGLETFTTKASLDTPQSSNSGPGVTSNAEYESSDHDSEYGGDTGLHSQANFASEFLEHAVERTSLSDVNPKMSEALKTLRQLVQLGNQRSISHGPRFPLQRPVPPGGVTKLSMPSQVIVTALLKENKGFPLSLASVICSLADIQDFHGMVRDVYFATHEYSEAAFTIVNAGLYMLFLEALAYGSQVASKAELETCLQICRANLETCLLHTPLFLSTKIENVQALYFGAVYAIDVCRPSVAWQLVSMAAQLCQTGGYHRAECLRNDDPKVARAKSLIFWQVYTMDKSLSLRLGRAGTIADYDISIPRTYSMHGLIPQGAKADYAGLWLNIAEVQGRIYEQLYSPSALKSPSEELIRRAQLLADECRTMEVESMVTREYTDEFFKYSQRAELLELFIKGDELQFLSAWCLVQRVIPAPEGSASRFNEECLATARKAMARHQDCIKLFQLGNYVQNIYMHWNLMLTPFAPFFILFCYIIETSSAEDLAILQNFASTLDLARDASEASHKFATLCRVMCEVVTLYVEAKSQQNVDQTMGPIGDEFEVYLNQLGFMPMMPNTGQGSASMGNEPGFQHPARVSDWYSGSMNMMGLVEEDLSGMGMGFSMPMGGAGNMGGMGSGMGGTGMGM